MSDQYQRGNYNPETGKIEYEPVEGGFVCRNCGKRFDAPDSSVIARYSVCSWDCHQALFKPLTRTSTGRK